MPRPLIAVNLRCIALEVYLLTEDDKGYRAGRRERLTTSSPSHLCGDKNAGAGEGADANMATEDLDRHGAIGRSGRDGACGAG